MKLHSSSLIYILLLLICLIFNSCANYRLNYSDSQINWSDNFPETDTIEHTMFLIGDAGNSYRGQIAPALQLLKNKLDVASEKSSVIFLGDNIYPDGMPPKSNLTDRKNAERKIDAQLTALTNFKGRPIFIPGNHDWRHYGLKGLKRQEKYIEKALNKGIENEENWENYFLPDQGCSGPVVLELSDNVVVIIIDSQWSLENWDLQPDINDGCEAKSRKVFEFLLEEALRKNRHKNVVIATHHPLYSNGPHGGHFTIKQHLFPLTDLNDNAYIPIPIIGSIAAFLRGAIGFKSDIAHYKYAAYKETVLFGAKKNGRFIFASGHEHNLQYIERDSQYMVISGNGSKKSPARIGKGTDFAYGGSKGFAQLDFYMDGSVWVKFWVVDSYNPEGKEIFRKKIKEKTVAEEEKEKISFEEYEMKKDSLDKHLYSYEVKEEGPVYNLLMGKHYRDLYRQEYKLEVLDLSVYKGGVKPVKRGGGNQTNSLRLEAADGKQFVMRSMEKDASRFLPYPFNKLSFADPFIKDNFMSTHPFAAISVAPLAEAAGIYHTNPKLYYVPQQPALETYNDDFGGAVYLVEEHPSDDWQQLESFGNSKNIVSTETVFEKILKNHDHKIDQQMVIRSRLFDLLIGDFDRHNDQWRWASFKDTATDITTYRPIPRDRDQAFPNYDGIITRLISRSTPFLMQLSVYQPKTKNMKWLTYGGRTFDRTFMNEMTWKDWEAEVKFIQENLTDEAIDNAFKTWPEYAFETTGKDISEISKKRRDGLMDLARRHYLLVAKNVDIIGTEKKELFKVERLNDNETRVRVYQLKNKTRDSLLVYDRIFYYKETKEIRLFGEQEEDRFHFTGKTNKGILIRAIGGLDEDKFLDQSYVRDGCRKTLIYDTPEGNIIRLGTEGKDMTSNDHEKNLFNKSDYHYEYNYLLTRPLIGYNPDNGLAVGGELFFTKYKFKKSPYGSTHRIQFGYSFGTAGYDLTYEGNVVELFDNADFLLEGIFRGPKFVENYFGLGNDTKLVDDIEGFDFNRVRLRLFRLKPAMKKTIGGGGGYFSLGPVIERIKVEETAGRFVTDPSSGLSSGTFIPKYYGGAEMSLLLKNLNTGSNPTRGISLDIDSGWKFNLNEKGKVIFPVKLELTIYESLNAKESIVYATRVGTSMTLGDYEFFQAPVLGGNSNLRGFRAERFSGDRIFYHNNDFRFQLQGSNNAIMPFSFGLSAGFDYGRVWLGNENSDTWHYGYGAGVWFIPIDYLVISAQLFQSAEDLRLVVKIGHAF